MPAPAAIPSRRFLLGSAVAALVVATLVPLSAQQPAASGTTPSPPTAAVVKTATVTLVTGDRLRYTRYSDGKQAVTLADPTGSDHRRTAFEGFQAVEQNGELYAFPVEVGPYLGNLLDRELFNVSRLVAQGYADKATPATPLIVTYRPRAEHDLPAGVERRSALPSIDGVAARQPKSGADRLGNALDRQLEVDAPAIEAGRPGRYAWSGPLAGVERIYLDQRVSVALDESVPLIGAPTAWEAGYDGTGTTVAVLDTGIDTDHPDVADQVVASQSFIPGETVQDGFGHGTHVASIVAGTGAASDGQFKGVAPGADLMVGKVLNNGGSGSFSGVIDGMEWAAANGADVVNLSLGCGPFNGCVENDGTDPASQAVNELTASTGTLFVIAAGNDGPGDQTVGQPGVADAALTVGATDKSDQLADFSSRGPRFGDAAVKPDITGPGVEITAARSTGTDMGGSGTPVDENYIIASGTSMATPHVAGAAAILQQVHPDWTAAELKAVLTSTATDAGHSVFEQGTGRVDVVRAYSQQVYATSGSVNFGFFPYPHDADQPVTKTVTYRNLSDADVTLDLALDVADADGNPAPDGLVGLAADTVTVPAGGEASVDVTMDPQLGELTRYGGTVVATADDVSVRVPLGFYLEPEMYDLTVNGIARDGRPAGGISWVDVVDAVDTTAFNGRGSFASGSTTLRLPPGTYSVMGTLFTYDQPQVYATDVAVAGDPQVEVTGDTTVTIDARDATEVTTETAKPTEPGVITVANYRAGEEFGSFTSSLLTGWPIDRVFAAPTEEVTVGEYEFYTKWQLRAPQLRVSVTRPEAMPVNTDYAFGSPMIDGVDRRRLVYVGLGRPEDYEGRDVRGKAVLVRRGGGMTFAEKVANATEAGAATILLHNDVPGLLVVGVSGAEIPVLTMSKGQGELLRDLLEDGPVTLRLHGIAQSPYNYDLLFPEPGRIADSHHHVVDATNTVRIDARYHSQLEPWFGGDAQHAFRPYSFFSFDSTRNFAFPIARTEWVSVGDSRWWHLAWGSMADPCVFCAPAEEPMTSYPQRGVRSAEWFEQPLAPGTVTTWGVGQEGGEAVTRTGNEITASVPEFNDDGRRWGAAGDSRTDTSSFRLYENGELLHESGRFAGDFAVSGDPADYRAELDVSREADFWSMSTDTETVWRFASAPPSDGATEVLPLLMVDYDLGAVDLMGRVPRAHQLDLAVHPQVGASDVDLADVRLWVSYDDGGGWRQVALSDTGDGHYRASLTAPDRPSARFVALRVRASDTDGNSVYQEVMRAYGLQS
jgi:subtilisin family serine protease